ncbi:tyrosine-protein phosphatase [Lactiplantibacillus plantarum]|uniref:Tyrosine-protein phosphatase n=2 Tax=Lactobacillaceae TaxID=33958 RepID=A0A0R2NUM0_9LACO|nr:CpsB/CapC family capsule biosynthesis tyrosine phosphatase [Lactiplantibacillus plantarum]KRO29432.1 capsular polysaccharide biosynthesis protein [Lactiplantibacillus fabifermentans DSM 21115]
MVKRTALTAQNELIDLHCHILPNVDDGSRDLEESLNMARNAVNDGIKIIVATPHHLDRHFINNNVDVVEQVNFFNKKLKQKNIPLTVLPGQEVHLNGNLLDSLPTLLFFSKNKKYLLIELPHEQVPEYTEKILFDLKCKGITPIIAHPERNLEILHNPEIFEKMVADGCLGQLTATSLVGGFGHRIYKFSKFLVKNNLVQVIASDAHCLPNRNFQLQKSYRVLNSLGVKNNFIRNSELILQGKELIK